MIDIIRAHVIPAAFSVLPKEMRAPEAAAFLTAIAWQESRVKHRRQLPNGPARSFLQFEQIGVSGVLSHPRSKAHARTVLQALRYSDPVTPFAVYDALAHNDILAFALGRLLLWTLPERLPRVDEAQAGWGSYLRAWRPGKPHEDTWGEAWRIGWDGIREV